MASPPIGVVAAVVPLLVLYAIPAPVFPVPAALDRLAWTPGALKARATPGVDEVGANTVPSETLAGLLSAPKFFLGREEGLGIAEVGAVGTGGTGEVAVGEVSADFARAELLDPLRVRFRAAIG